MESPVLIIVFVLPSCIMSAIRIGWLDLSLLKLDHLIQWSWGSKNFALITEAFFLCFQWQKFLCSDGLHFFVTLERQLKCLGMKVVLEYLGKFMGGLLGVYMFFVKR